MDSPEKSFEPATRIFGVVAREAPVVVLIRRGPTKRVLLVRWNTATHEFHSGQWLKGRIYEERCDLSPSGDKLIYLAADNRGEPGSWTAVSRPPFLTAIVLWKNLGSWGGGGMFDSDRRLLLNVGGALKPYRGFKLPKGVQVSPIASWAGHGEDDPLRELRMKRDGWIVADPGEYPKARWKDPVVWQLSRPRSWRKAKDGFVLERRLHGISERNGRWYIYSHHVMNAAGDELLDCGRSDWADWSLSGELLLARDGCVYRATPRDGSLFELERLIDLRGLRFEPMPPSRNALEWKGYVTGKRIS
jgi:hypothetical protein